MEILYQRTMWIYKSFYVQYYSNLYKGHDISLEKIDNAFKITKGLQRMKDRL